MHEPGRPHRDAFNASGSDAAWRARGAGQDAADLPAWPRYSSDDEAHVAFVQNGEVAVSRLHDEICRLIDRR